MIKRAKKIIFKSDKANLDIMKPMPASRLVPDWYRKMSGSESRIETVKKCIPVLDALTAGYVIPVPADVTWIKDEKKFFSQSKFEINSDHHSSQTQDVVLPPEYDPQPHKWVNSWYIKTPPGYSTLFIHPLNRLDLPFYSFTGVVDTDKHPLVINFPFVLRKDFDGVIPAGTPMIQAIPFKRDGWDSSIEDDESYSYPKHHEVDLPPFAWYKRNFWTRKLYR